MTPTPTLGPTGTLPVRSILTFSPQSPHGGYFGQFVTPVQSLGAATSAQDKVKRILNYCKVIQAASASSGTIGGPNLPQWYDVNYAYSGLHSIIHPPPPNVNLWGAGGSPFKHQQQHHNLPEPSSVECKFCYENYRQVECQFYLPQPGSFAVTSNRKGKVVVCECCDFSDEEQEEVGEEKPAEEGDELKIKEEVPSTSSGPEEVKSEKESEDERRPSPVEKREVDEVSSDDAQKRIKVEGEGEESSPVPPSFVDGKASKENAKSSSGGGKKSRVKPGWYGKGYGKKRKKKGRFG